MREAVTEVEPLGKDHVTRPMAGSDEVTVSLVSVIQRLVAGTRLIVLGAGAGLLLGIGLALALHPWYQAEAVFLPPAADITSAMPTGAASSATAALLSRQDPTDLYLGLLTSRSVAEDVINRNGLMDVFHARFRVDARVALGAISRFTVNKNELIYVQVKWSDPALAAAIANSYLDALYRLNGQMVTSASSHREEFFQSRLAEEKEDLSRAETDLKTTEEKIGIVSPEGEAQAGLAATSQLQAQVAAARTRLAGLRAGATEQNSEVVQARTQLAELQSLLEHVQAGSGTRRPGAGLASTKELPGLSLEYARKLREVKLRESVYTALAQQYERAKLSATDPGPQLQVVDRATAPERKAGPSRRLFATAGLALGLLASLAYILLSKPLRRLYVTYRSSAADDKA